MMSARRPSGTMAIAIAAIVVTVVAVVFGARRLRADQSDVPTMVLEKGRFVNTLEVRGEIRPIRSVVLTAPSSGSDLQIIDIVANGATVKSGDVVIRFDSTAPQRILDQRQSELQQANSEVAKVEAEVRRRIQAAEATLAELRSAAERARLDLTRTSLVSKVEAEKLALAVADAEHKVKAQEAKLVGERRSTAADLAIVKQKRDKAAFDVADNERIIRSLSMMSPADGQISLMPNFRVAQGFSRSAPEFKRGDRAWFGAPIAELPDLSSVRMSCRVDEADRARVPPDAKVRVRVDAIPDRELPGTIDQISIVAKPDFATFPPTRNFDVSIAMSESDSRIKSGMSATAVIELDQLDDVVVVPDTALFSRDGHTLVYVVAGRSFEPRPVTVARRSRDRVAIASGVSPGERIALRDPTIEVTR
ncbi:MAG: efflux RND transporter periplasmic adaptor subunit [Cyanobacteria bacterium]|nr:efflux RND transporter periplasmic adaptor subunit [Cyanobacteriota bacterium]